MKTCVLKMNSLIRLEKISKKFNVFRCFSSNKQDVIRNQNKLFDEEAEKQKSNVGRIEKIEVKYDGLGESKLFVMNKDLSTPYNVAQHISEWITKESVLALVNGEIAWDMHRPLEESCTLKLLRFIDDDPFLVNKAFWKFCSFLLGATIQNAFADNIEVTLHSFPSPQITSGSFVYDTMLNLKNWKPTSSELRIISADMVKMASLELPLERLRVREEVATEIFSSNKFKLAQIPNIASSSGGQITLYRMGNYIDISKGPLIGNSSLLGRCTVTAVHQIESEDGPLYRFQGVALPKGLMLNHFAYKILEDRAKKLNCTTFSDQKIVEIA